MADYNIRTRTNYRTLRSMDILPKALPADPERAYGRKWDRYEFFRKQKIPLKMQSE